MAVVSEDFFAPPPFKPDEALLRLKRELRDMGLAERDGRFERRGVAIARVAIEGGVLQAAVVRKPSRSSPEWRSSTLAGSAAVRDFAAVLKKQLASWSDVDD
jgi:hypothetical protein